MTYLYHPATLQPMIFSTIHIVCPQCGTGLDVPIHTGPTHREPSLVGKMGTLVVEVRPDHSVIHDHILNCPGPPTDDGEPYPIPISA